MRIEPADLAKLQRNIVLSHAAGVGEPTPVSMTRLMMALKLGSLAQGASGVRSETIDCIERDARPRRDAGRSAQGSVGASGDLAPLAHMAAAMIGVGEAVLDDRVMPAAEALAAVGLEPLALQPKEGLALLNGTQFSTAHALVGLFEAEAALRSAIATGALRSTPRAARTRRSIRASMRCAVIAANAPAPKPCAPSSPAARSAPRTASAIRGFRTPIACAASRR